MYEKIAALIARNDFVTAEQLLKKYDVSLTQEQKDALWKFKETQQQENQRAARKSEKNKKRVRRWGRHGHVVLPLQIKLARGTQAGLIIFVPYLKNKFYAWPEKFIIPTMEIFLLVYLVIVTSFCALEFMDEHIGKISNREARQRAENPNRKSSEWFQTFQNLENRCAEGERNWLIALIFFSAWSLLQLWQVFSMVT